MGYPAKGFDKEQEYRDSSISELCWIVGTHAFFLGMIAGAVIGGIVVAFALNCGKI